MTCSLKPGVTVLVENTPAQEAVCFARDELARYLGLILGTAAPDPASGRVALSVTPGAGLTDEGYEIEAGPGRVSIRGGGPAGLVYGVYECLRRHGGCQFSGLGPDGEHVSRRASLDIPAGVWRREPRLWYRGLQFSGRGDERLNRYRLDWMAKNGLNYVMVHPLSDGDGGQVSYVDPATGELRVEPATGSYGMDYVRRFYLPELRKRGLKLDMNHHNLFYWLPPETYFREHPDWYALRKGIRSVERAQLSLCTSNRAMAETLIANIKAWLRNYPEGKIVGLVSEDGRGMCECEACRRLDLDPADATRPYRGHRSPDGMNPSKSRRYALLLNEVARALRDEFPGVLLGAGAYVDLQWPAQDIGYERTILPWVAMYWRCAAHPLARGGCAMNDFFFRLLESWKQVHDGPLILYEYYMGMNAQKGMPYPMAGLIAREWPGLRRLGIGGATIQCLADDFNTHALNYLAFARCGWEEHVDTERLLDDYLLGQFGAAAPALKPIYRHFLEKTARIEAGSEADNVFLKAIPPAVGHLLPNGRSVAYFLDAEGDAILRRCLADAAALAAGGREARQLDAFRAAAGYWRTGAAITRMGEVSSPAGVPPASPPMSPAALEAELGRLRARPPDGWLRGMEQWQALLKKMPAPSR